MYLLAQLSQQFGQPDFENRAYYNHEVVDSPRLLLVIGDAFSL